jgi:hypothetical protein
MENNFKLRFWQGGKWLLGLFLLLFIFRLFYGYVAADTSRIGDSSSDFFGSLGSVRKNYASEKSSPKIDISQANAVASSQKFEKTAALKSKSSEFEQDEKLTKARAKSFNAVIQYEQNLGQKGSRQLHLLIGVAPTLFDSFYIEMQKIGSIKGAEVTKVDKTNEYKQLNAKKASLEKTLQSLVELKSRGGAIADYVTLHDKILEIETQLQELGVELGNFDAENEFCTVKFSLYEGATEKGVSFVQRVKVALEWTIKYCAILIASFLAASILVLVILLIINKLKTML